MSSTKHTRPYAFFFSRWKKTTGKPSEPKPLSDGNIDMLPDGIGEVEDGSIEEQIWRELGALPPSRRAKSRRP